MFTILLILTLELRYPQKRGETEKGGVEIEDRGTFIHLYWCFKKINAEPVCFFLVFGEEQLLKAIIPSSFDHLILLICQVIAQNREKDTD